MSSLIAERAGDILLALSVKAFAANKSSVLEKGFHADPNWCASCSGSAGTW